MNHVSGLYAKNVHGYMDIDIEFGPGANVLYGVNGSGKSTALRIVASVISGSTPEMMFESITAYLSDGSEYNFERTGDDLKDISHTTKGGARHTNKVILSTPLNRFIIPTVLEYIGMEQEAPPPTNPSFISTILKGFMAGAIKSPEFGKFTDEVRNLMDIDVSEVADLVALHKLPTGQQHTLSMLYSAALARVNLLLIDEPEASLHIDMQSKLPGALMRLMSRGQVVVSTHSPEIFSAFKAQDATITELLI